jgi:hypothetical protein
MLEFAGEIAVLMNQALDEGVDLSFIEPAANQLEFASPEFLFMLHCLDAPRVARVDQF